MSHSIFWKCESFDLVLTLMKCRDIAFNPSSAWLFPEEKMKVHHSEPQQLQNNMKLHFWVSSHSHY